MFQQASKVPHEAGKQWSDGESACGLYYSLVSIALAQGAHKEAYKKSPLWGRCHFGPTLDPSDAPDQIIEGWRRISGKHHCRVLLPHALCKDLLVFIIRERFLDGLDLTADIMQFAHRLLRSP